MFDKHCKTVLAAAILASMSACTITDTTSTTSGSIDTATPDITLNRFVDVSIASIKQEAAAGEGENLDALARLMGKTDTNAFSGWMQTHYDELFIGLEQPSELISRIESISRTTSS